MPKPLLLEANDIPQAWKILVPEYKSAQYSPLILQINQWDDRYAIDIENISEKRSTNRWQNYCDPKELKRVEQRLAADKPSSIRFGVKKEGHGYHGERGDFCLVGGSIDGNNLTLMYRSLELIGGFAYDLTLIRRLGMTFDRDWKRLRILADRAHIFALKGNSNEKLFPKLRKIFNEN